MEEDLILTTGGIPSPRDYRDIPIDVVASASGVTIPEKYQIPNIDKLPVWYQRKIGACVGHAAGKYAQYLNLLETKKISPLSARFLYALAKSRDGFSGEGTYPRLVAKILKDHGCATEATVPNDTTLDHETYVYNRDEKKIPDAAWKDARPYRIGGYAFADISSQDQIMQSIFLGKGAIALMRLGKEWYTAKDGTKSWKEKDILPLRPPATVVSGHEIFYCGYERKNGRLRIDFINSWSEKWGALGRGYFWHDEHKAFLNEIITFVDIPNSTLDTVHNLPSPTDFRYYFGVDIKAGESGEGVKALQTALMIDGVFDRNLYSELLKEGSLGYFKPSGVTQKALLDYQIKHKVAPMSELLALKGTIAGVKTRAMLNSQFNG